MSAAKKMSTPIEVTPVEAVSGAMWAAAGEVAFATAKVAELEDDELLPEGKGPNIWLRMKWGAEERLVKYAKTAHDIGIDSARLRIEAAQTALMARFIEGVLSRIELTPAQRKQVGPAIRKELATVSTATEEPEDA